MQNLVLHQRVNSLCCHESAWILKRPEFELSVEFRPFHLPFLIICRINFLSKDKQNNAGRQHNHSGPAGNANHSPEVA